MATKNEGNSGANTKKRKQYLPHNKPVKKKGGYPLRPGIEGFFITCDGGRERQASHQAIDVIDSFYEDLVCGKKLGNNLGELSQKPMNKKIVFSDSSSSDDEEQGDNDEEEKAKLPEEMSEKDIKSDVPTDDKAGHENQSDSSKTENASADSETKDNDNADGNGNGCKSHENDKDEAKEPPVKKQCVETGAADMLVPSKVEEKSIDKQIEAELKELGDKNKRRFISLDSGCNGVVIIQMRRKEGDPSPKDIVQHMMTSAAATRKHMSRYILRVLPIEVACYSSEEEISRAIKPLVSRYFPTETEDPSKFAVSYNARANSGIDRMKIIDAVAKSVSGPHKVNLSTPDKTIVVEIVKTVCLIGVVEKFKELAKYNLRQLTSTE